jgi:hypothetical protein
MVRRALGLLAGLLGLLAVSCDSSVGKVSGKVTLDGQPLKGALVEFQPEDGGRPSMGVTDDAGNYELLRSRQVKGAAVGKHTVRITTANESEGEDGKPVPERVPPRYNAKSELVKEVTAGSNTIDLDLRSRGATAGPGIPR